MHRSLSHAPARARTHTHTHLPCVPLSLSLASPLSRPPCPTPLPDPTVCVGWGVEGSFAVLITIVARNAVAGRYQNVHAPNQLPPLWEVKNFSGPFFGDSAAGHTYANMLHMLDSGVANVTAALTTAGMWCLPHTISAFPCRFISTDSHRTKRLAIRCEQVHHSAAVHGG